MKNIESKIVNITAEYAKVLLRAEHIGQIRRRSERHVDALARIMSEGKWQDLNGDTIVLDTDGKVIDGQHRLLAVIKSGRAITTILVTGVKPEAYYSIDLQSKPRNLKDVLKIDGYKNYSPLATALRCVWFYRRDMPTRSNYVTPSVQDLVELLESDVDGFSSAAKKSLHARDIIACGQAAFLFYIFAEINESMADEFFKYLISGVGFKDGNPIRLLRDRLISDRYSKSKMPIEEKLGLCITAWNAFRTDKHVKCLRWKRHDGKKLPEAI